MTTAADALPRGGRPRAPGRVSAVAVLLFAMLGFQSGAALGKGVLPLIGAAGVTTLRLVFSAAILAVMTRPWRGRIERAAIGPLVFYGLGIAATNCFFYQAIRTVPLGLAMAINFTGPLGVALVTSRRASDVAWALLAACGLLLLLPIEGAAALDPGGLAWCLAAAAGWAGYMTAGRRAGRLLPGGRTPAVGMVVAALVVLPFGIAEAGASLIAPAVLPTGLAVALLAGALPFWLEMRAMTRLPPRVFGVLMSLEPVVGTLMGWLVLSEHPTLRQTTAILMVVAASAGMARSRDDDEVTEAPLHPPSGVAARRD